MMGSIIINYGRFSILLIFKKCTFSMWDHMIPITVTMQATKPKEEICCPLLPNNRVFFVAGRRCIFFLVDSELSCVSDLPTMLSKIEGSSSQGRIVWFEDVVWGWRTDIFHPTSLNSVHKIPLLIRDKFSLGIDFGRLLGLYFCECFNWYIQYGVQPKF